MMQSSKSSSILSSPKKKSRQLYLSTKHLLSGIQSPKFVPASNNNTSLKDIDENASASATAEEVSDNHLLAEFSSIDDALSQFHSTDYKFEVHDEDDDDNDKANHQQQPYSYYAQKYQEQVELTESLLKELEGTPLDLEALLAAAGQVGQQEFQFASFDDENAFSSSSLDEPQQQQLQNKQVNEASTDDEDFGEFQAAKDDDKDVAGSSEEQEPQKERIQINHAPSSSPPTSTTTSLGSKKSNLPNPQDVDHSNENEIIAGIETSTDAEACDKHSENDYEEEPSPSSVAELRDDEEEDDAPSECTSSITPSLSVPSVVQITAPAAASWRQDSATELMSSASGRFLHRTSRTAASSGSFSSFDQQQQQQDPLEIPEQYLQETNEDDIIESTLTSSIDWDKIYFWKLNALTDEVGLPDDRQQAANEEEDILEVHESITTQLSTLDGMLRQVQQEQQRAIVPHTDNIHMANSTIHEFSKNLALAQMYKNRTQVSMKQAREGIEGSIALIQHWNDRDDYQDLNGVLERVASMLSWEASILELIDGFDCKSREDSLRICRSILDSIVSLQQEVSQAPFCDLNCLDDLRKRSSVLHSTFLKRLFVLLESVTVRCCSGTKSENLLKPDTGEYSILSETIFAVYNASSGITECIEKSWAMGIQTALLFEVDRSLVLSLLDPTDCASSQYDTELTALNYQMEWGNLDSLNTILANIVTIRFDLEASMFHLPAVFHRLVFLLTSILQGQQRLIDWHLTFTQTGGISSDKDSTIMENIAKELDIGRSALWIFCIKAMERVIDEYLQHLPTKVTMLFMSRADGKGIDDSKWWRDLDGIEDVVRLAQDFLSLRSEATGSGTNAENFHEMESSLREKLSTLSKKHVRAVHIAAMNNIGMLLSKEDWELGPIGPRENEKNQDFGENPEDFVRKMLAGEVLSFVDGHKVMYGRSASNAFHQSERMENFLSSKVNPFSVSRSNISHQSILFGGSTNGGFFNDLSGPIDDLVRSFCGGSEHPNSIKFIPTCFTQGLLPWASRLILVASKLPSMSEEVPQVLFNIFDLFFVTVLRICSGSKASEEILIGSRPPPRHPFTINPSKAPKRPSKGKEMLGHFRRRSSSSSLNGDKPKPNKSDKRPSFSLSPTVEAELSGPLPKEMESLLVVQNFVDRAQESLKSMVKLDHVDGFVSDPNNVGNFQILAVDTARTLEKRLSAAWAIIFAGVTLEQLNNFFSLAKQHVGEPLSPKANNSAGALANYVTEVLMIAPSLFRACHRISVCRALRPRVTIQSIISLGPLWLEESLHEQPNDYVDETVDWVVNIWSALAKSGAFPESAQKRIWETIVDQSFMILVDAFSKVPFCCTEGRALMSMDVAAFASKVSPRGMRERLMDAFGLTTSVQPKRFYVDGYIKAFYYPPSDLAAWIDENYQQYYFNHVVSLISSSSSETSPQAAVQSLKELRNRYQGTTQGASKDYF